MVELWQESFCCSKVQENAVEPSMPPSGPSTPNGQVYVICSERKVDRVSSRLLGGVTMSGLIAMLGPAEKRGSAFWILIAVFLASDLFLGPDTVERYRDVKVPDEEAIRYNKETKRLIESQNREIDEYNRDTDKRIQLLNLLRASRE